MSWAFLVSLYRIYTAKERENYEHLLRQCGTFEAVPPLGVILGALGYNLDASQGLLGHVEAFGGVLDALGGFLEVSGGHLEASGRPPEGSWTLLRVSWKRLVAICLII